MTLPETDICSRPVRFSGNSGPAPTWLSLRTWICAEVPASATILDAALRSCYHRLPSPACKSTTMRQALAISGGPDLVGVFSLHHRVAASIERLRNRLHAEVPQLAQDVSTWMDAIAPGGEAANYLSDPLMFPILQLPAWLLQTLTGRVDARFLSDVTYSTVSGYYHVR